MLFNLLTEGRDISICHLSNIYLIVGAIITDKETDSKEVKLFAQGHTDKGRYGTQTCPLLPPKLELFIKLEFLKLEFLKSQLSEWGQQSCVGAAT